MIATLDQQLIDLCKIHSLSRIEIVANNGPHGPRFDVYVARSGVCESDELYGDSISAAFKDAVTRLNGLADVKFPPLEALS